MAEEPNTTETQTDTPAERMARATAHAESFLAQVHGDGDEAPAEGDEAPDPKAAAKAEQKGEEATEEPEAGKEEGELVAPQLAAVVKAQQRAEAKIAAREDAVAKREAELVAKEAKFKEEGSGAEDFKRLLRRNPKAALEAAGIKDREGWHRKAYYAELPPDKRPAHYDALERLAEVDEELAEQKAWRAKREADDAEREKAAKEAEERAVVEHARTEGKRLYEVDLGKALEALPKEMKYLPLMAAEDKAEAVAEMYGAAEKYFAEHQKPPTPAEAAQLAEAAIAARMKPFEKHLTLNTTKPAAPDTKKAATRTLTAGKTATPTKPRAPATTEEERLRRATEAAAGIWR